MIRNLFRRKAAPQVEHLTVRRDDSILVTTEKYLRSEEREMALRGIDDFFSGRKQVLVLPATMKVTIVERTA